MSKKRKDGRPLQVEHDVYPRPDPRYEGAKIGLTWKDSRPDYPSFPKAPVAAPNVVIVLLDDAGYGVASAYGGLVRTPTAEKIAREGLQYCQFHTTAICAPTRAALLTGRNAHSVSQGIVAENATGYPGYAGIIPRSTAFISEILSPTGLGTACGGRTTTFRTTPPVRPALSTIGRYNVASIIFTVFSEARPTTSIPLSSVEIRTWIPPSVQRKATT